ncbi:MAG: hypothetical protein HOD92_20275, partial [Deltaproteobacteria bacterium]|nr:hypothetical protein [Deltaproteobacteria bacterium]
MGNTTTSFHGVKSPVPQNSYQAKLIKQRSNLLGPSYRLFYKEPFCPIRGEGVWL